MSCGGQARRITGSGGRCKTRGPKRTHKNPWRPKPSLQPPPSSRHFTLPLPPLPAHADDIGKHHAPAQRVARQPSFLWAKRGGHVWCGQRMAVLRRVPNRARLARSAAGEAAQQPSPPAERQRYFHCVPGHHPLHREPSPEAAARIGATAHAPKKAFPPSHLGPRVCPAGRRMSLSPQGPAVPRCPQGFSPSPWVPHDPWDTHFLWPVYL